MGYWRSLRRQWQALTPHQQIEFLGGLSNDEVAATNWWFVANARENQLPPDGDDWSVLACVAGRGWGKTKAIAEFAHIKADTMPGSRGIVLAATASDARDVVIEGQSGIMNTGALATRPEYNPSKRLITWPNGTTAYVRSADNPDRLRGPQCHWFIADELASWRYGTEAWDMLMFGFRLGDHPQGAVATTPKNTKVFKELLAFGDGLRIVKGSTYENRANLSKIFFDRILAKYEGTRLGRQEINAELISDSEHALWHRDWIQVSRVTEMPQLRVLIVGVDPSGTKAGDEQGIIAGGFGFKDGQRHLYIIDDVSLHGTPDEWGRAVVTLYNKLSCNYVVAESNYGGDMVKNVIQTIDPRVPVELVHASRGKAVRAEPVSSLYQQGRAHHVGTFAVLEDEMCQWEPLSGKNSPNRLDALVWVATELMLKDIPSALDNSSLIGQGSGF